MSPHVVLSDHPMIDPERQRRILDGVATVSAAELGSTAALVAACEAADADGVVVDVNTPVTAEALERLDLAVVGRSAVGVDNVDLAAAADRGVTVVHVPAYCTDEVATHALSLLLACVRAVPEYDRAVRAGRWPRFPGRDLHRMQGRTVGFLSFGAIARRTADLLAGFDVDRIGYDPYVDAGTMADRGVESVSFDGLLARSDYLVANAPATPETEGMLDADAFAALPEGAVLVNTGRGAVVDEAALVAALDSGSLAAAGLDVLRSEPPREDHPLLGRDDVVVTPHAGWYSEEARIEVNETVAHDVRRVLRGEAPENPVDADWL